MEEISTEVLMRQEQRTTEAPPPPALPSYYYQSPCDLAAGVISAVLRCLGLGPSGSNNPRSAFSIGTWNEDFCTSEDDAVQLKAKKGRSPKKSPISPGEPPQHN